MDAAYVLQIGVIVFGALIARQTNPLHAQAALGKHLGLWLSSVPCHDISVIRAHDAEPTADIPGCSLIIQTLLCGCIPKTLLVR
jgi:hypothetical protein